MNYHGRDKDIQVRVGLMTILTLVILLFGYSWLRDWFSRGKYNEVSVMFTNAGNIEVGDPVTVYGTKRGWVYSIDVLENGALINIMLDIAFPLPIDSKFYISDSNLMGSKQLDIVPGISSKTIDSGFIPEGESLSSLSTLVPRIDSVISGIDELMTLLSEDNELPEKIMKTIETSNNVMERIDSILSHKHNEIDVMFSNLSEASVQLNEIMRNNKDNLQVTFDKASSSFEQLEYSLQKIDDILHSIEPIILMVTDEQGTVYKLLNEEELYERIIDVTASMDSLLVDIKKNPGRYFRMRLF